MAGQFAFGAPDAEFARGDVPMTKAEVRAVTLAKARLSRESRVLDVGAGTGALAVEAARLCADGEVVAVERSDAALELLRVNAERLAPGNLRAVAGEAPDAIAALEPGFDAVLVGGSGGRLEGVLAAAARLLAPGGRVVVNAIGMKMVGDAMDLLGGGPWIDRECVQVSVAKAEPIGSDVRFVPANPVWVVSATLDGEVVR